MPEVDRTVPVYPMGVVQRLTGLTARQIRYYEQEGLLQPARTKGNRRLYAPEDVDRLLEIKQLLAEGLNVEGVRAWLQKEGKLTAAPAVDEPATPSEPPRIPTIPEIDHGAIIDAMRSGKHLSSLFPVNYQAELVRRLALKREREQES